MLDTVISSTGTSLSHSQVSVGCSDCIFLFPAGDDSCTPFLQFVKKSSISISGTSRSERPHLCSCLTSCRSHGARTSSRNENVMLCIRPAQLLTDIMDLVELESLPHELKFFADVQQLHGTRISPQDQIVLPDPPELAFRHLPWRTTTCPAPPTPSRSRPCVPCTSTLHRRPICCTASSTGLTTPGTCPSRRPTWPSQLFRTEVFDPVVHACTCHHPFLGRR